MSDKMYREIQWPVTGDDGVDAIAGMVKLLSSFERLPASAKACCAQYVADRFKNDAEKAREIATAAYRGPAQQALEPLDDDWLKKTLLPGHGFTF